MILTCVFFLNVNYVSAKVSKNLRDVSRLQTSSVQQTSDRSSGRKIKKEAGGRRLKKKKKNRKKDMRQEVKRDVRWTVLLTLWEKSGRMEVKKKNRHRGMQMAASSSICKGRNICAARTVDSIAWKPRPRPSSFLSRKRSGEWVRGGGGGGEAKNKVRRRLFEFSAEKRPRTDASRVHRHAMLRRRWQRPAFRRIGNFISKLYRYGDVDRDSKACVIISYQPVFPSRVFHDAHWFCRWSARRIDCGVRGISIWIEYITRVILKQWNFLRQKEEETKFIEKIFLVCLSILQRAEK